MKRFFVIGTVFCCAALIGIGVGLLTPSDAYAVECDEEDRQHFIECDANPCLGHKQQYALWDCGTEHPSGHPCNCILVGCYEGCP